ncbi:Aste57867_24371 [Aphanomyces stellatus]|uniref:Aste57867_24371 protein n=1 Tax=Aphanomyces stellatus TaxID=120398 RepID=A0A485LUL2_9STRA|nr:hypothetical protein As57867_024295 [Aphanomyces stellatus]VFU01011.1 Aste57867_24371 [Aphanomyces stellatus]
MEGSKVYVPDDKLTWVPATVMRVEDGGKRALVRLAGTGADGKVIPDRWIDLRDDGMPAELPLQNDLTTSVEDMCTLNHLHEPAIVYNLRKRFEQKNPYTYTGTIVVAINPYAWLNLYSKETQQLYLGDRASLPPHVYATSASSFQSMVQYERHQSILVSGESGAGKTETVKILMEHLATVSTKNPNLTIVSKVLKSNPLLEAFGNAKTIRNDNSSRFGKFTQLQFDLDNQLVGAKCRHYLLEKSRVITQSANERNYHIFYQLRASGDARWALTDGTTYTYLREDASSSTPFLLDGDDDKTRYDATRDALSTIGVSDDDQLALFDALAGILHVGQVQFQAKGEDSSQPIQSTAAWDATCRLLGFAADPSVLATSLCNRTVKARLEVYVVPLSVDQAQTNRDAMAKELYARLFSYLVHRVNDSISNDRQMKSHIDLLDIFGFEAFETNRFEQFCINFANEKLQQKFTHDVFKTVQEEYEEEGLGWTYVSFKDNQDMLDLLEAPLGVIPLLNEECIRPMGNDLTFCSKVAATHDANPRLDKQKARLSTSHFALRHYAGTVMYNVDGFVETNKDALSTEVLTLLSTSSNKLIQHVFRPDPAKKAGASSSFMGETVVSKFKTQLAGLMSDIAATQVHYIRCIKPNSVKSATQFDLPGVIDQLRCAGVVEAIRISRAAFPNKMSHERFLQRFVLFQTPKSGATVGAATAQLATFLVKHGESKETFVVGTRHIYFAAGVLEELEKQRTIYLQSRATLIQRMVRGYIRRRRFLQLKAAVVRYQALFRKHRAARAFQTTRRRLVLLQALWRGRAARRILAHQRFAASVVLIQRNFRKYCARKAYHKFRQAVITLQAQQKQKAQQAKFLAQKRELMAQQTMEQELVSLKTRLEEEKHARQTTTTLDVAAAAVPPPTDALPPPTSSPGAGVSLLDDSGRMLETLQREVQKLRELHERDAAEMDALKSENKRIKDAYTAAGASFAALNQHNKQQSKANLRLMSTHAALIKSQEEKMKKYQKQVQDLKDELKSAKSMSLASSTAAVDATHQQERVLKVLRESNVSSDVLAKVRAALAEAPQSSQSSLRTTSTSEPSQRWTSVSAASEAAPHHADDRSSWAVPKDNRGSVGSIYYEDDPNRKSGLGGMFKKMFKKNEGQ